MSMVPPTPRKPPVVTQDSRSPLRRGLDALASTWRQSGIGNYLPSPNEVGRGVASFLFPTAMAAGRDVKPTDFLGDAALAFAPVGLGNTGRLSAIVRRLNKSEDVGDFMTPEAMAPVGDYARQGLYRPGAKGGFTDKDLPTPASQNLFGLVPTEKLAPLREFDRAAEPVGGMTGPDNITKLMQHMAEGGKWSDPLAVAYYPNQKWGYLAEGNHRLALAEALGLEKLPATVWRQEYGVPPMRNFAGVAEDGAEIFEPVGRKIGDLDVNQLALDRYSNFSNLVGERYIPPTMHPFLLKYFQPR